jgi:PD-(D/E)XK nuclease superfamily
MRGRQHAAKNLRQRDAASRLLMPSQSANAPGEVRNAMKKAFSIKSRELFDPTSEKPFKVSRSGIELFLECSRCFYINHRLGIRRPSGPPFNINSLVDRLLKKEFDVHRVNGTAHPLMQQYRIDAIPYQHPKIGEWRQNFKGVQTHHVPTNLIVTGAVDDLWLNPAQEIIVVDYKATAKSGEVTIDAEWQQSYKRQMEVYQWLVRRQGLSVSDTGYFVYCNGQDAQAFDGRIEFAVKLLPYTGSDCWVEGALGDLKRCLLDEDIPDRPHDCEFCGYARARAESDLHPPETGHAQ